MRLSPLCLRQPRADDVSHMYSPVKLQKIQAFRLHALQRAIYCGFNCLSRHRTGLRAPFCEALKSFLIFCTHGRSKEAHQIFRRAIVVGTIKGCVARGEKAFHHVDCGSLLDLAPATACLPEAV